MITLFPQNNLFLSGPEIEGRELLEVWICKQGEGIAVKQVFSAKGRLGRKLRRLELYSPGPKTPIGRGTTHVHP